MPGTHVHAVRCGRRRHPGAGANDACTGDFEAAYATAPVRIGAEYTAPTQNQNPIELFASQCVWESDQLTVHEPSQYVNNVKFGLARLLCRAKRDVLRYFFFLLREFDPEHILRRHAGGERGCPVRNACLRSLTLTHFPATGVCFDPEVEHPREVEKADEQKVFLTRVMRVGDDNRRDGRTYPDDINSRRSNSARCPEGRRASRNVGLGGGVWRGSGWHPRRQHILGMEKRTAILGSSTSPSASPGLSPSKSEGWLAQALLVSMTDTDRPRRNQHQCVGLVSAPMLISPLDASRKLERPAASTTQRNSSRAF